MTEPLTAARDPLFIARLDRILRFLAPAFLLVFAADLADLVMRAPMWWANECRLAPAFAFGYGYNPYPGEHFIGPIIGTLHAPLGYLLFSTLSFLRDPVTAIAAACALNALLVFAPLFWIHWRAAGTHRLAALYGFLACASIVLISVGTRQWAAGMYVDAGAFCCTLLAAGLLTSGRTPWPRGILAASAALSVVAVACKQTAAPGPLALACFVLLLGGWRQFARYVSVQVVSGAVIAAALLVVFRPADLLFNTWSLTVHRQRAGGIVAMLPQISAVRSDFAIVVPALLFLLVLVCSRPGEGFRARLLRHRWLVFLLLGLFQLPAELRALTTYGGGENHVGAVSVFIMLAATVGLTELWRDEGSLVPRALLAGIVVALIYVPWDFPQVVAGLRDAPVEVAWRYEKLHPGRAYFPVNPLATLLASGRFGHYDLALSDREVGGYPITPAQFAAGLPPHYKLVAFPMTCGPVSAMVLEQLRSMKQASEPGLEGWYVFVPAN